MNHPQAGRWRIVVPVLMVIAYPVLVHAGVMLQQPILAFIALQLLVAVALFKPLLAARLWAWAVFIGLGAALYALTQTTAGRWALYLPSLVIPAMLGSVFGSSLRGGREPFISAIARAGRGGVLAPDLALYTRRLTQLWTAMFVLMWVVALALILLDEFAWWSLVTNVLNYVVIGLMFAVEYAYRRWRYAHHPHPGFVEHIVAIARHRPSAPP